MLLHIISPEAKRLNFVFFQNLNKILKKFQNFIQKIIQTFDLKIEIVLDR